MWGALSAPPSGSPTVSSLAENLLQNSVDDSWTDTNLNRVSVIQFVDEPKAEEEEEEAGAEKRVCNGVRVAGRGQAGHGQPGGVHLPCPVGLSGLAERPASCTHCCGWPC